MTFLRLFLGIATGNPIYRPNSIQMTFGIVFLGQFHIRIAYFRSDKIQRRKNLENRNSFFMIISKTITPIELRVAMYVFS